MKSLLIYKMLFLLILTFSNCETSEEASQSPPIEQEQSGKNGSQQEEQPKFIGEFFIQEDSIAYNGYEIVKLKKEVDYRDACSPEYRNKPCIIPVFYTVIMREGRILAEFDDYYFSLGNGNDFALYPLLGGEAKQLFISQTAPRSGRHYVVELTSKPRVIFDSSDYEVGREEVEILDLDNDGVYEISLAVTAFYMVYGVSMAETPLPQVIFKYDLKAEKYLPANHIFQSNLLKDIEETKNHRSKDARSDVGRNLAILLDYIYAGKEEEGWAFFELEYNLPDKVTVKSDTLRVLRKAPAYRYIGEHRAN